MQRTLRICICSAPLAVPAVHAAQPVKGGVTYPPGDPTDISANAVGQTLTGASSRPVAIGRAGPHAGRARAGAAPYEHPYL